MLIASIILSDIIIQLFHENDYSYYYWNKVVLCHSFTDNCVVPLSLNLLLCHSRITLGGSDGKLVYKRHPYTS